MDIQRSSLLSFPLYFCQGKTIEELRYSLLYATMELEQTKLAAQEEIKKRDNELAELENLLTKIIQEKDDLHAKYQNLFIQTLLAQQHQQVNGPISGISSEDQQKRGIDNSNSSDCEESIVSSPPSPPRTNRLESIMHEKPLPEKGRLLEAVMRAGPLLQNLLLAGPLPEWKHPPPPLDSLEIPPVNIPSPLQQLPLHNQDSLALHNKKRPLCAADAFDSTTETKYKRLLTTSLSNSPN